MTFSIAARDAETGAFGLAVTTSGLCVGARCPHARAGVGAVLTQHRTDPRLGPLGLKLLSRGLSAAETVAALTAGREDARWRQLAVVDDQGRTAAFHGAEIYSRHGHAAAEGAIALGNLLRSETLPNAMLQAFLTHGAEPLERRLIAALEAGVADGGELMPLRSAALLIVAEDDFSWMDMRIDRSDDPIGELAALARDYAPSASEFRRRVVEPETIPNDPHYLALHAALTSGETSA
ncbi:MAG: DUF1028 domain-containing protein [Alphaproteobacteria bacterium]|nr:DUF1028 domain-containing protein [Alphaproteobacteria bacterium]